MNKHLSLGMLAVAMAACSSQPASTQKALSADSSARSFGIASYLVDGDTVTLLDENGIESGRIAVSAPTPDDRVFTSELADGTLDRLEVYRPMADGRFLAPLTPETVLTTVLADSALASTWAAHQVTFKLDLAPRLVQAELAPNDVASTTACSSYSCTGSGCTPLGCAKPANTTQCFTNDGTHTACTAGTNGCVCCDNPSQLPAAVTQNNLVTDCDEFDTIRDGSFCNNYCLSLGCQVTEWVTGGGFDGSNLCGCGHRYSANSWPASCARAVGSACVSGQYDKVPRNGSCVNPGSCTYSTGTVGCTTYH